VFFVFFVTLLLAEVVLNLLADLPDHVERLMGPRTLQEEAQEALDAVQTSAKPRP
jgi:hypothetical protein